MIAFDADALRRRLCDDQSLMDDVIAVFLEDLPIRLAAIQDAVTRRNASDLRAAAHALKGAAANFSALALCQAADELERVGAESRMDAADTAWQHVSRAANSIVGVLQHTIPSHQEQVPPCAS
jgi:HPt (histidine-containing phosphotransfer) domain-containing protein